MQLLLKIAHNLTIILVTNFGAWVSSPFIHGLCSHLARH
jgi:hypothetical protein